MIPATSLDHARHAWAETAALAGSQVYMRADAGITQLLARWSAGDHAALDRLAPLVYRDLKRLAVHCFRSERNSHTLQPTALVHEVYLRLARTPPHCRERSSLYGIASHVMREVLAQYARARSAAKRGSGKIVSLADDLDIPGETTSLPIEKLHDALTQLESRYPRQADILQRRYFEGFHNEEIAAQLQLSVVTIERDLRLALAWMRRELISSSTA